MASPKAPFSGKTTPSHSFSEELKFKLVDYYPTIEEDDDLGDLAFEHPSELFVETIISEAQFVADYVASIRAQPSREELHKEQQVLLNLLNETERKLSSISLDLLNLLDRNIEPLVCVDEINKLIPHIAGTYDKINLIPDKLQPKQYHQPILIDLAVRVIRVMTDHGIPITTAGSEEYATVNSTIKILKDIGDDIGLNLKISSWITHYKEAIKQI